MQRVLKGSNGFFYLFIYLVKVETHLLEFLIRLEYSVYQNQILEVIRARSIQNRAYLCSVARPTR